MTRRHGRGLGDGVAGETRGELERRVEVVDDGHRRQAREERRAVGARPQARIAEHDEAAVVEVADEPADTLLQREHGLRQLQLVERIAAGSADRFGTRLHERIARHGERQLVDHDEPQRAAAHVDALPEAARAEQDRVAVRAKLIQQLAARASALDEHAARRGAPFEPALGALQRSIAREQQKRSALRRFDERPNRRAAASRRSARRSGSGKPLRQVDPRVALVVERARQHALERGRRPMRRRKCEKSAPTASVADANTQTPFCASMRAASAAPMSSGVQCTVTAPAVRSNQRRPSLGSATVISRSRAAQRRQRSRQLRKSRRRLGERLERVGKRFERARRLGQRVAQRRGRGDPRRSPFRPRGGRAQRDDRAAERALRRIDLRQHAGHARLGEHVAQQRLELARADRPAEELLRDVGQLMRLVDDHGIGSRQQLAETRSP